MLKKIFFIEINKTTLHPSLFLSLSLSCQGTEWKPQKAALYASGT